MQMFMKPEQREKMDMEKLKAMRSGSRAFTDIEKNLDGAAFYF